MQIVVSGSGLRVRVCISSKLPGVTDAAAPGTTLGIVSPKKWMILWVPFIVPTFCVLFLRIYSISFSIAYSFLFRSQVESQWMGILLSK